MQKQVYKQKRELRVVHRSANLSLHSAMKDMQNIVELLESRFENAQASNNSFYTVYTNAGKMALPIKEVMYCEAKGNYTVFHIRDSKPILVSKSLKQVVNELYRTDFIRCHQSYYINQSAIKRYHLSGHAQIELNDSTRIPVSRRKKRAVKGFFNGLTKRIARGLPD